MKQTYQATPTATLALDARRLEGRILDGIATDRDIDAFMLMAMELGARQVDDHALESVIDPRD